MVKVLAFLEADLPRVEAELNLYMNKFSIAYIYHTGSRLVFILKEKSRSGSHKRSSEPDEE